MIIIPKREIWTRQPQHVTPVRGVFAGGQVWTPPRLTIGSANDNLTLAGVSYQVKKGEVCYVTDGSTQDNITLGGKLFAPPWSYLIRVTRRAAQNDARLTSPVSGTTLAVITCDVSAVGQVEVFQANVSWNGVGALSDVLPIGEMRTLLFSCDASRLVTLYADGKKYGSSLVSSGVHDSIGLGSVVGGVYGAYGATVQFDVSLLGVVGQEIRDADALSITGAPWQIFAPKIRHVFVGASGGGDVSLALSGSLETFTSGNLSPQVTVALSGNSLTSAQGSLGPGLEKTLNGSVESFAAGTLSGAVQLALSGNALTFAFGTLTVSSGYVATLTGLEQTFFSGSLAPGIELALSGNASSLAYGAVTVGAAYIVALTGLAQTLSSGTLSPGIELSINGQAQTAAFGLFSPEIQTELTGRSMTLTPGTLSIAGGSGGIGSLDPATIAAIAAAIWSDPRAPTIAKLLAIKDG